MEGGKEYLGFNILKREKIIKGFIFQSYFYWKRSKKFRPKFSPRSVTYTALVYQVINPQPYSFSIQYGLRIPV